MALTVAIMQPYAFPYLGYFSLVEASDIFVFYDDVNYIPRGWINRNRLLINGAEYAFTIPVAKASQNQRIDETRLHDFAGFRSKFLRQLHQAYGKAACFDAGYAYVESVLATQHSTISELAMASVEEVFRRAKIGKRFMRSSLVAAETRGMERAARLIAITRSLGAAHYVNALGGTSLYDKASFSGRGVELAFVSPKLREYPQFRADRFVTGLSIIDVLMNNPLEHVVEMIGDYELV